MKVKNKQKTASEIYISKKDSELVFPIWKELNTLKPKVATAMENFNKVDQAVGILNEKQESILATFAALKQREEGRNSEFSNLSSRIDEISNKITGVLHNLEGDVTAFNERLLEIQKEKQTEDDFAFRQAALEKMFRRINRTNGDIFRRIGKLEAEMQAQNLFNNKIPAMIQHQMDGNKILKLSNWLNYQNAFVASVGVIVALVAVLCLK